jgi:hypothetical protein
MQKFSIRSRLSSRGHTPHPEKIFCHMMWISIQETLGSKVRIESSYPLLGILFPMTKHYFVLNLKPEQKRGNGFCSVDKGVTPSVSGDRRSGHPVPLIALAQSQKPAPSPH